MDADSVAMLPAAPAPVTAHLAAPGDQATRAALERLAGQLDLQVRCRANGRRTLVQPDGADAEPWREDYPYQARMRRRPYRQAKHALQIELVKLQRWVKASGQRLLIVFEGRDAAGKGGTIRRFTENLNPRGARVVALGVPASHQRGADYLGRYLPHLPAPGEIALFDRSWYNRAGVERVMGFCDPRECEEFLREVPAFEAGLAADGIALVKLWFSVTRAEQLRRFIDRQADPLKRWKLSQVDLGSLDRWEEYTIAEQEMFTRTSSQGAPWSVIRGNDKRRARLEAMRHVLSLFDYSGKDQGVAVAPDPRIIGPPPVPPHPQPPLVKLPAAGPAREAPAVPA